MPGLTAYPSHITLTKRFIFQISLGPLRCVGVGLSDGEVMERLWSYLRRFSRMTKEMRPAHRVDVLVHALLYWGMQKKDRLCKCLSLIWTNS